jgi:hypothetical protein
MLRRAKSESGEDGGSPRIEVDTGATEDDAWRCFAVRMSPPDVAGGATRLIRE